MLSQKKLSHLANTFLVFFNNLTVIPGVLINCPADYTGENLFYRFQTPFVLGTPGASISYFPSFQPTVSGGFTTLTFDQGTSTTVTVIATDAFGNVLTGISCSFTIQGLFSS